MLYFRQVYAFCQSEKYCCYILLQFYQEQNRRSEVEVENALIASRDRK